jgi:ABC-2 type transport system permease protein
MTWEPGALAPAPEAAPRGAMLRAQSLAELRLTVRNGEQILLNLIIPLGLLTVLVKVPFVSIDGSRVAFAVPGVLALAIMSSAFTGQAIATGFERYYGVLKRLGATPLPRSTLLLAKTLAVLTVEVLQLAAICALGLVLGWNPHGNVLSALLLIALGTAAFSGLGLLLGGTLRGLTSLAVANLLWFVLTALGGVVFPLRETGAGQQVLQYLPTAALSDGLRTLTQHGDLVGRDVLTLTVWALVALAAAARAFRWE